jgi:hypothetical protein
LIFNGYPFRLILLYSFYLFRKGVYQRLKVSITRICEFGAWTWCAICLICL